MFTDEVSQKGAKDMSQKNMEVMLSMEDKAEAEELTAFLQSVNITKQTLIGYCQCVEEIRRKLKPGDECSCGKRKE